MQLVAYGAQDIYLTGNPQITFFKVVYRRHTNFSMEAIEQTLNGTPDFDGNVDCTISRNGDLIHKMYVEFNVGEVLGSNTGAVHANVGHTILKEMELEIGGQRIDKHYSHWLTTWNELTDHNPTGSKMTLLPAAAIPLEQVAGGIASSLEPTEYQKMSFNHIGVGSLVATSKTKTPSAYVPLQFWFCRNVGLALPLIALQYHEVKLKIKFCPDTDIADTTGKSLQNIKLWVDYIYLDTDERRRFAQVSHEYLIEQLQTIKVSSENGSQIFNFNHPVKELIWIGEEDDSGAEGAGSGTPRIIDSASKFKIKLNGHDRFSERTCDYFTKTQVYQHHSGFGGTTVPESIAVYSFALKPEEHQPSGTCNFSRIDNSELVISNSASGGAPNLRIYAVNYNVLRIMSGMGGLAYSN